MWERLSLRTRLLLPLGLMFVAALLAGGVSLQIFATAQLMEETEPAARSAKAVAAALNGALRTSANPQATLDAFVQSLGDSEAIRFRRLGTNLDVHPPEVQTPLGTVPDWFVSLISVPEFKAAFPVMIEGKQVGDIVFAPDMSADIYEKWVGFLAIICSGVTLMLLTAIIAHFAARSALRPLQTLGDGLTRMRTGDYEQQILPAGPPEIRKSSQEANELARTLNRLSQDNRSLLRRMVSLQDDERQDMARELHDELGPLLFGIRANTVALLESIPSGEAELKNAAEGILQSVETLQQANRRILDRLRPLYIQELGLEKSIQTLLQNVKAQAPDLKVTSQIDAKLNEVDGLLSQTVYRVIQEAVTNVLRHAKANSMHVAAAINDREVIVEVSDDGVGFPTDRVFGRGLTGMLERVRALSGTLELLRESARTCVRCRLPARDSAADARGAKQN
ncbi:histidine kinase [Bradyrhizobium valentinum]|uniref:histidine kinase n=1 Tax=Bradyrhizobium valentinum TaxID=1518501 RepID=A0A0R3L3N2_9BRAD|nr:histidine kinase [Bradyrhizobium valentinum]KRQ99826.1 histidine kinase [Bradyrhizobium valentinum]KRR12064.1 histidine kinase [Bradyrhizobium valentinum]